MNAILEARNWEWTIWDAVRRVASLKLEMGDEAVLARYKDAWVRSHRQEIAEIADTYALPDVLLAGICWVEVGGDGDMLDSFASASASSDRMSRPFLGTLTVTQPSEASGTGTGPTGGPARVAEAADDSWDKLNAAEQARIVDCLKAEACNVGVVARQLAQLKRLDFGDAPAPFTRLVQITGTRYRLGPDLPLSAIEMNTRYGDFILRQSGRLRALLSD